jgi:hypothetical protein
VPRPIYSTQFVAGILTPSGPYPGIIPPLGSIAVLRDIQAWTAAGGIGNELLVQLQPVAANIIEFDNLSAGNNYHQWNGRVVLTPEIYCLFYAMIGTWNVIASGYLLTDN